MTAPRPLPNDPAQVEIAGMLVLGADWHFTQLGDIETFAVEAMTGDGGNYQPVVAVVIPTRLNHAEAEDAKLRFLIHPDDAITLAAMLVHSARILKELTQ